MSWRKVALLFGGGTIVLLVAGVAWYATTRPDPRTLQPQTAAPFDKFSYDAYAAVLDQVVDERGMVNYRGLKASPQDLETLASQLAALRPDEYDSWREAERIAFWINAYNALTLKLIVEHYPIKRSLQPEGLAFPSNSIHQIPGQWTKIHFPVMGRDRTLDEIEHQILRKQFKEPRIHMALVCAAMGCPPLRGEPFVADRLDEQLDDQTRRFLRDPARFAIDRRARTVHLSPIFEWFGGDFVEVHRPEEGFGDAGDPDTRAVLKFISGYLSPTDADLLRSGQYRVTFLKYDWSLNEQ